MVKGRSVGKPKRDNYPYATARVKARKSTLIPRSQYEKFLVMELPAIARYISETAYNKEISDLSTQYSGLDLIEMATYQNLARNYREVLGFCGGKLRENIEKYLAIWDTWNIKTILRGLSYGASRDEIMEDLVPAGTFSKDDLKEMVGSDSIETLLDHLKGTKFYKCIMDARTSDGTVDLMTFENEMDGDYFVSLLTITDDSRWLARTLDRFFREQIDVVNLKVMFKLKYAALESDYTLKFIIPGGYELSEAVLKRLAMTDSFESFVNELKTFKFWSYIKEPAERAMEEETLNPVMNALDDYHIRTATKFGKLHPLSILPFLDYFIRKKIEVDNIRIICRGKQAGLSHDLIKSMLIG